MVWKAKIRQMLIFSRSIKCFVVYIDVVDVVVVVVIDIILVVDAFTRAC
jgi:hypothetical protein